ncbi:MAG: translation initiation factor IF-2 [Myxococcota bacterium]
MAKVRAYKIAEELGIERSELVAKAAAAGFELANAMVGLEEEQVDELRRLLGGRRAARTEDRRVGGSIIRRRRARPAEPAPEAPADAEPSGEAAAPAEVGAAAPEELPAPESIAATTAPPVAEPAPEPPSAGAPETEAPLVAEPVAPEPAPVPESPAPEAPSAPPLAARGGGAQPAPRPAASPSAPPGERAVAGRPGSRRPVRRTAIQGIKLKEQETIARQMRGNVQMQLERRRQTVEQQSRIRSTRRHSRTATRRSAPAREQEKKLRLSGSMTFPELSRKLGVKVYELLRKARQLGLNSDRDALLDVETVELLAGDFDFEVKLETETLGERVSRKQAVPDEELEPRPPVVTVMGHVDHGKTSLLDRIRNANVVAGEAGGITQHIGAYQVDGPNGPITFIDTPGHAAFTQMRARGAQITDIAVLVVAADDGVMPQTIEAISHARSAGVPILVAINKVDKPDADPQRVKQALLEHELVPEDFGGETICVEVSATQGTGIDKLLEMIGLQAELLELRARSRGRARGTVVEAQLDRGRGPVATVLVSEGTLEAGDAVVLGTAYGRVRSLLDHQGAPVKRAGPATPVQLIGLSEVPEAGDEVIVVANEREAKAVVAERIEARKRATVVADVAPAAAIGEDVFGSLDEPDSWELRVVLKADVRGTLEAIRDSLRELSTERVQLDVIHAGVGAISESDVTLAAASQAIVLGFHVRPESAARKAAERDSVDVRTFDIVYEVLDEARRLMGGLLPPRVVEKVHGEAEVRQLFQIPRQGTIAGCAVREGVIQRSNPIRLLRDGVPVYSGRLRSLRHFKDDVREIRSGQECGIQLENFNDVKVGDVLESFTVEETPDSL